MTRSGWTRRRAIGATALCVALTVGATGGLTACSDDTAKRPRSVTTTTSNKLRDVSGQFTIARQLELDLAYRIDLFDPHGVRVYQKSTFRAPEPRSTCYGDCPDHAAPPDGWDYVTCGGGVTFFPLDCSIGESNEVLGVCRHVTADDSDGNPPSDGDGKDPKGVAPRVVRGSWGKIKSISREKPGPASKH